VRKLFAATKAAKARRYDAGRFSFNVAKGRCETWEGEGSVGVDAEVRGGHVALLRDSARVHPHSGVAFTRGSARKLRVSWQRPNGTRIALRVTLVMNRSLRVLILPFLFGLVVLSNVCLASAAPLTAIARDQAKPASGAAAPGAAPAEPEEKVAPDSPRAAISEFRQLTRKADFSAAAQYLDLSSVDQADGPMLAQHLREVLARHLWIELDKISPNSHGNTDDGLNADQEQLGSVPGATGQLEPVLLERKSFRPGTHWVFAAATVAQIEGWYEHLGNTWLVEHMPKPLLRMGPYHLRRWQWLGLVPLVIGGWLLGFAVTRLAHAVLRRVLSERGASTTRKLRGPAALGLAVTTWYAFLPWLGLYEPAENLVHRWFAAALLLAVFWALWKTVELSQHKVGKSLWAKQSLTAHSLLLLGARLAKFAVAAVAFIVVLAELGYHATTIITGLGIGGIALALAAQKTVENLFGAFSLAIDQPFREGDTIQVDTITGTVEAIGLRSTRIRTADRTIISIPNGKLADMRVETISSQDRLRFYCVVGVAHSTGQNFRQILSGVERLLRAEPKVDQSTISVHFVALTDAAMNLEIAAMLDTTDGNAFLVARQELLLGVVAVIEGAGSALAHPRRTITLHNADQSKPETHEEEAPQSGSRRQTELARHGS
jgi:MscS family membrane protein